MNPLFYTKNKIDSLISSIRNLLPSWLTSSEPRPVSSVNGIPGGGDITITGENIKINNLAPVTVTEAISSTMDNVALLSQSMPNVVTEFSPSYDAKDVYSASVVHNAVSNVNSNLGLHVNDKQNPHSVTAAQVGTYNAQEIDNKINQSAAHYLTWKNAQGQFVQFATHAALSAAKAAHTASNPQFWYGVEPHTPDKNDYCIVLADETHNGETTRYAFVGEWDDNGYFRYQYTVNETAFSEAQWDAINSGVTASSFAGKLDKTGGTMTGAVTFSDGNTEEERAVEWLKTSAGRGFRWQNADTGDGEEHFGHLPDKDGTFAMTDDIPDVSQLATKTELAGKLDKTEAENIIPKRVKNDDDTERIDGSGVVYPIGMVYDGGTLTRSDGMVLKNCRYVTSNPNGVYYEWTGDNGAYFQYWPNNDDGRIQDSFGWARSYQRGKNPLAGDVLAYCSPGYWGYTHSNPPIEKSEQAPIAKLIRGTIEGKFTEEQKEELAETFAKKDDIPITVNDINAYGLGRYVGVLASSENPMTLYKNDIVVIRSQEWPGKAASSYGVFRFINDIPMKIESGSQLPTSSPLAWEEINASESGLSNITNLAKDFGYSIKGALETDSYDPYQIGMTHFLLRDHEIGYIEAIPENLDGSELVLVLDHEHDGTRFDSVYRIRTRTEGSNTFEIWICCKDWNGSFEINRDSWTLEEGKQYLLGITYFGGDVYTVCITEVYA